MPSFNSLNGIPSVANKWLMNQVLREEWGFAGVVISLTGIALTMYIEHTTLFYPVGGDLIEGIQGRYFIPCFLPMVLALSNNRLNKFESMKKETAGQGMSLMAVIWSVGCALVTIGTLLFRYWI